MKRLALALLLCLTMSGCAHSQSTPETDSTRPKHHLPDGTFRNNYLPSINKPFADLFKWWWTGEKPEPTRFPLAKNDPAFLQQNRTEPTLTWIGHATLLIQFDGLNILTDPHLTERASPVSFGGYKRHTPPGLDFDQLPEIDMVVISHNHYDHLDRGTVEQLYERQHENPPRFFVPLKQKAWFDDLGIPNVVELDWGQSVEFRGWQVHAVPVQHWSSRTPWDRNTVLWAGWVLEHPQFRFFFAGDTGYSQDFLDLGQRFGGVDLAAIPIGAYEPRWFMKAAHVNPEEAVKAHQDVRARFSVGIHWGTFQLTDEPMDEPPKRLQQALADAGIPQERFFVMQHGETRSLDFLRKTKTAQHETTAESAAD
ncbi:MAG: MBL fold metallo-hydrolase [SAR324 cluster bacterium]|nr:MBL fold metallo-hydrolase [SAR324 cluster bacterium]